MTKTHRACYRCLAAVIASAHLAYLVYVPAGGLLALRRPRTIWPHLAAVCWGLAIVILPLSCPLTSLENWARARGGMKPLPTTGFVDRYVAGVLYPAHRTGAAQALAFGAAAASWIMVAGNRARTRKTHAKRSNGTSR